MTLHIEPIGFLGVLGDTLMVPLMYALQGTLHEVPNRTHRWNNLKLSREQTAHLRENMMVSFKGDRSKPPPWWQKHAPIIGGWRNYHVVQPIENCHYWHLGWLEGEFRAVSRIPIPFSGAVRSLIGGGPVSFFGVNEKGVQITLRDIGCGRSGYGGRWKGTLLL